MSSSPVVCDRLTTEQLEPALDALRTGPDYGPPARGVDGFRHLYDRQREWNRYLYRIAGPADEPLLLGLSERFCPLANRSYAGLTLYHPHLKRTLSSRVLDVRKAAYRLLTGRPEAKKSAPGRLRMLIGGDDPYGRVIREQLRDWHAVTAVERAVRNVSVSARRVSEWQGCVHRTDSQLPVWRRGHLVVRVCRPDETWDVYQMQRTVHRNQGGQAVPDAQALDRLRRGVERVAAAHAVEGLPSVLRRGAFLVLYDRTRLVGCAWCYRSFTPDHSRWTVWLRWPYLTPAARGWGMMGLLGGGVGLFTEPGAPVLARRLGLDPSDPARPVRSPQAVFYEF